MSGSVAPVLTTHEPWCNIMKEKAQDVILTLGTRQRILLSRLGVLQLAVVEVLDAGLDLGRHFFGLFGLGRHCDDGGLRVHVYTRRLLHRRDGGGHDTDDLCHD